MNPIKKTIEVLTGHRLATTTLITAALMLQAETDNKFIAHGFGSYITAFLVGFARDYSPTEDWGKRFFLRKDMTPIENILNLIRHNPVIIGAIGAAIGGITYPEVLATNQQRELSPEGQKAFYTIMGIGAGGIISETAAHCLIKQRKLLKKGCLIKN